MEEWNPAMSVEDTKKHLARRRLISLIEWLEEDIKEAEEAIAKKEGDQPASYDMHGTWNEFLASRKAKLEWARSLDPIENAQEVEETLDGMSDVSQEIGDETRRRNETPEE